jgi:hypothetical protein
MKINWTLHEKRNLRKRLRHKWRATMLLARPGGKLQRNYAIGGAREILKMISGPATRVVSAGKAVMPMATGAETFAATRWEVAV